MTEEAVRYAVLLRKPEQLDFHALAAVLARRRGCPVLDAMHEARACWGILGEGQDEAAAKKEAAALTEAGFDALALPQSLLEDPAPAVSVVKGELGAEEASFSTAAGEAVPAGNTVLLCAAIIKRTVTQTVMVRKESSMGQKAMQMGLLMATGLPIKMPGASKEESKTIASSELTGILDIVLEKPARRLRVLSEGFDYSCLKGDKTYDTLTNLRALGRRLAALRPQAARNRGLRFILDSRPQRDMGYEALKDLERECRWLLTLQAIKL